MNLISTPPKARIAFANQQSEVLLHSKYICQSKPNKSDNPGFCLLYKPFFGGKETETQRETMDWFYTKRRGPEWKQGWTGQTLSSISTPPLHLLTIFAIVIVLLWFSKSTDYKAELKHTAANVQLFFFLLPILLIFVVASNSTSWRFNFPLLRSEQESGQRAGSSSPLGIAILVVLLLVLLSFQSSFHSKWFGPLWR